VIITHLSTFDCAGGAAKAAYRLHRGLLELGHESRMVVRDKASDDPTVTAFSPPLSGLIRLRRVLTRHYLARSRIAITSRPASAPYFSDDRSEHAAYVLRQIAPSDILNLHWIAGLFDYSNLFGQLPIGVPVVWTLHDMNAFTGGCHFDGHCGKYLEHCGACPQLGSSESRDLSSEIWGRKRRLFGRLDSRRIQFVTPSRWLAEEMKRSPVLGKFPVSVLPYGIDTDTFQPRNQIMARERFAIPQAAKVILFVAHAATEKRKGWDFFLKATEPFRTDPQVFILAVGYGSKNDDLGAQTKTIESVDNELAMSFVYSAADIFVAPSLQDNFPNTALEALACGLPVVAFDVGGLPDMVRNNYTGVLVEPENSRALGTAIGELLDDGNRRLQMSTNCRRVAVTEYALEVQAGRYIQLYESMLRKACGAAVAANVTT
jgi:glycosyltransferase involved in cell wall biosynthesis